MVACFPLLSSNLLMVKHEMQDPRVEVQQQTRITAATTSLVLIPRMLQASCNEFGLTLLYDEARQNFLKGFYPCKEKDTVHLAAISTRILYGNTTKMRCDKFGTIETESFYSGETFLFNQSSFFFLGFFFQKLKALKVVQYPFVLTYSQSQRKGLRTRKRSTPLE